MADVQRLSELQLVPVLDMLPWQFSDREPPEATGMNHTANWSRHWFDCLEEAGITGLNPITPASFLVPAAALTDLAVLECVLNKLVPPDALADPDSAAALAGGAALVSGETVLVEPNCCGDLKDWCEWRSAADHTAPDWTMVWSGHPWISVRAGGADLVLSGPHETESPEPHWVFRRDLVLPAVERAVQELERFADRLTVVLLGSSAQGGARVRAAARRFAGLLPLTKTDPAGA